MSMQTLSRTAVSESVRLEKDAAMERLGAAIREVRQACSELPVLAVHWMHLKQPIHPVQEQLIQQIKTSAVRHEPAWPVLLKLPWRFGVCLAYGLVLFLRLVQMRLRLRGPLAKIRARHFDLVAKSWSVSSSASAAGEDFYYGDLQKKLEARGVKTLMLCGNSRGRDWKSFTLDNASAGPFCRLPEGCLIPLWAPLRLPFLQWKTALRLLRLARTMEHPLSRRVALLAARDCLNRQNMPQALVHAMGRNVVRTWRPKAFLTLYEGYGWEQCVWAGVKEADPACRTVGFQHTVLFKHNLELLHPLTEKLAHARPDLVLCSGPRTAALLRGSHARSQLVSFGTFRPIPGLEDLHSPDPGRRTVLVLPEGYAEECRLLFNSAMRAAQQLPEIQFVFRCHPVLPFEKVRSLLDQDPDRLPNVTVSQRPSITQDFEAASAVLYRGSSSVLYAILYGLKPIYLHQDRSRDVDPLFELTSWKERVCSPEELTEVLRRVHAAGSEPAGPGWLEAFSYVRGYVQPAAEDSVDRLIAAAGLKKGNNA